MKKLIYYIPYLFQSVVLFLAFLICPDLKKDATKRYYNMYELKGGYTLENFMLDMEDSKRKAGITGGAYFPLVYCPNIIVLVTLCLNVIWRVNS